MLPQSGFSGVKGERRLTASRISERLRHLLIPVGGLAVLALAVSFFGQLATRHYLGTGLARAESVLRLTVNALDADLSRYEVVPQLIGDFDLIKQLIENPGDTALRNRANRWLERQNKVVDSSDIYLILSDGETIAASNYQKKLSFVGQNFSYRPYWIEAMNGTPARFYGIGTTSGVRGYFFSAPVFDTTGRIGGVVAVKVDVDRIEKGWEGGENEVLVTDPEGIAFLSTKPGWLYQSLFKLTPERLHNTLQSRRYSDTALGELAPQTVMEEDVPILRLGDRPGAASRDYVLASHEMEDAGWTVHVLLDSAGLRAEARLALVGVILFLSLIFIGAMFFHQRRARIADRLAMQEFHTTELERRVSERTADLARLNTVLKDEVAERRATEEALRAAQASLVQVGKLAALGQMSASLSHEFNQPLAAARNYADSAGILIDRGDYARARDNIAQILQLVDRMAAIGKHLRQAVRNPGEKLGAVDLAALVEETEVIVDPRVKSSGARIQIDLPADLPPLRAGPTRLQQVLVNLITNAADAVAGLPDPVISLTARQDGNDVLICVRDVGPGVPPEFTDRIFDPFFTTKGAGLGLGLSISSNIIRDFQGEITCRNLNLGAEFRVRIPIALKVAA